jgi:hypothetical protein
MIDVVNPLFDHTPRFRMLGAARNGALEPKSVSAASFWGPTMQSVRKAAISSTPHQHRANGRRLLTFLFDAGRAAQPTDIAATFELHNRIEVWVNEGGTGGEANQ